MTRFFTFLFFLLFAAVTVFAQSTPTVTGMTSICTGNTTTLTASSDPGATFKWYNAATGGTQYPNTNPNTAIFTIPQQNTNGTVHFYVAATVSGITSARADVSVLINQTPTIAITPASVSICSGSNTTVTASGAATYTWTGGPATAAYTVSPVTTSSYTVTGTSAAGCPAQATATVSVYKTIAAGAATTCPGSQAGLSASGAATYTWSPATGLNATTGDFVIASPLVTTTYTVSGTGSGCTSTDQVTVTVRPSMNLAAMANTSVTEGSIVNLTATSTGALSYVWTPNQGSNSALSGTSVYVVPAATTIYTVTGKDVYNCVSTSPVTVTVNELPDVAGATTLCKGSTTTLTATGVGPFSWYPSAAGGASATGPSFTTPAITGNRSYWVAGSNGVRREIKLSVPDVLTAAATPAAICGGDTSKLIGTFLGGIKWYTAATGGTMLGITQSGAALPVTPSSTTTYYAEALSAEVSVNFTQMNSVQTWTVPDGVTTIGIDAYGARGRTGTGTRSYNSSGGRVQATMNVVPGQILNIYVGGLDTWNGGGYVQTAAFGGDATDIRIGGTALINRVLVAGGGGGTGRSGSAPVNGDVGNGGGLIGQNGGAANNGSVWYILGHGGSQIAGGDGGSWYGSSGFAGGGVFGNAGNGGNSGGSYGGGGGGGWYGGGGGTDGGDGGGGSSYTNPILCSNVIHTQGAWNGTGALTITYGTACTSPAGRIPVTVTVTPNLVASASDTQADYCAGTAISLYASGLAPSKEVAVFNGTQNGGNGVANIIAVANNFTMDFWVKPANTITALTQSTGGTAGTGGQNYAIAPYQSGANGGAGVSVGTNGISVCEHGNSYLPALLSYSGAISGTELTHVAVVYTNKQPTLYVNGVLVATGLTSTMPNVYPSIGSAGAGGYGIFNGSLDNVRIWNAPLTAAEINAVWTKADATIAGKTLLARYSFNGGSVADDRGSPAQPAWNGPAGSQQQDYYTYTWSGTGAVPAASNLEKQTTATASGTTRYTVKVSHAGCTSVASDTVVASSDASPVGTISGTASTCKNGTAPELTFTGSGSTPPYTFSYKINGGSTQTITTPANATIRYVRVKQNISDFLHLAELRAIEAGTGTNVALGKGGIANSTDVSNPIANLTDNNITNFWHSQNAGTSEYVQIDLGAGYLLDHIELVNRPDCCWAREANLQLILSDAAGTQYSSTPINAYQNQANAYATSWPVTPPSVIKMTVPSSVSGTFLYGLTNTKSKNGCTSAATATATVTVNEYATITTEPVSNTTVCTANPVVLGVEATNAASYQWRKAGVNISGATAANYIKTGAVAVDAGSYSVIAINGIGCNDTSSNSAVTVSAIANTLAVNNATGSFNHLDGLEYNYTDASCQPIADVMDAAGNNILGAVTAKVMVDGTVQDFRGQPYLQRHYDIIPGSNGAATVKLYATQSEFDAFNTYVANHGNNYPKMPTGPSDITGKANISVTQYHGLSTAGTTGPGGKYDAARRELIPNSSIVSGWNGSYWTLTFPVSGFSGFFLSTGSTAPLAIKLMDIIAKNNGPVNEINWSTATEDAGDYMEVERSTDARSFTKIGTVTGRHTNGGMYSLVDEKPATGVNYYRLKMLDAGGENSYSKVVSASVKQGGFVVEVFPNPVKDILTIHLNGIVGAGASLSITDVAGRIISRPAVSTQSFDIRVNELAAGMYLLQYKDDDQHQTIRFTKQ